MNKERRKAIASARVKLEQAAELVLGAKGDLEMARDEEQEYYDNMPENMQQNSERGQNAEMAIGALDGAMEELGDIEAAIGFCEEAEGY